MIWRLIFFIPINAFVGDVVETVEQCRDRILNELHSAINNTDEIDKVVDENCNPEKGGFAKIPKFSKLLQENIINWFILSLFLTIDLYMVIAIIVGLIFFGTQMLNDTNSHGGLNYTI